MAVATLVQKAHDRWTQLTDSPSRLAGPTIPPWALVRQAVPRAVLVPGMNRAVQVKIASTRAEWEDAFQLVTDSYQARGYEPAGARELRFSSYHALPDAGVVVAKAGERVLATLSI